MYAKKVKRKCGVRGCGNKENVFAVSRRRETGNSVIICSDCLKEALALAAPNSGLEVQNARKGKKNAKRAQSKANGESEDGAGADGGEGDEGK